MLFKMKRVMVGIILLFLLGGCDSSGAGTTSTQSIPLYISGWLATYDSQRGLKSFSNNIQIFNEINPVWYNLNPNYFTSGQSPILDNSGDKNSLLTIARNSKVKVIPTVQNFGATNFDTTIIHQIIQDPLLRAKHVSELVSLVLSQSYDGIDIDYENLSSADQTAFSAFITELKQALQQHQKQLSVTVYAKVSANTPWSGPGAQDWTSLVPQVDTLKVMVYDYHWASYQACPISPIDWLNDVLKYARSVPGIAGKVMIGLPFYGIDWPTGQSGREVMNADAMSIINQQLISVLSRSNVDQSSDPYCGAYNMNVEEHFTYLKNGINHTVYFQDATALHERLIKIDQYRDIVKGVTFWRLGGEDSTSWSELAKYK